MNWDQVLHNIQLNFLQVQEFFYHFSQLQNYQFCCNKKFKLINKTR